MKDKIQRHVLFRGEFDEELGPFPCILLELSLVAFELAEMDFEEEDAETDMALPTSGQLSCSDC